MNKTFNKGNFYSLDGLFIVFPNWIRSQIKREMIPSGGQTLLSQTDPTAVEASDSRHTFRATFTVTKAVKRFKDFIFPLALHAIAKIFRRIYSVRTLFTGTSVIHLLQVSDNRRVTEYPGHVISNRRPTLCRIKEHVTAVSSACDFCGKITPTEFLPARNRVQEMTDLLRGINHQKCSCVVISCAKQVEWDLLSHGSVNSAKNEPTSSSAGSVKRLQHFCR